MTTEPSARALDQEDGSNSGPLLKLLLEVGPLVVFFVVNSMMGIFWGTGIFMAATAVSLVVSRIFFGRIPMMPLVSGGFVVVFGGLTLLLQDATFIKLKPTIVNSLFAVFLLGGLAFGRSLLRILMGDLFQLSDEGWAKLTLRWGLFFVVLAVLNEVVWRNFSESFWLGFKIWGVMPLTMVFAILQLGLMKRHEAVRAE